MITLNAIMDKYRKADAALEGNDPAIAERLLRELVGDEPDEPLFRWKLGYALGELKMYAQAIREFEKALKMEPDNIAALGGLGRAYMEMGEWQNAADAFRKRLDQKESPQHFIFLAHVLIQTKHYDEAVEACLRALSLDPTFAEAFLNIGLAKRHLDKLDEAITAFQDAIALDANYAVAYRELGWTYFAQGRLKSAETVLETSLRLNEHDAWSHFYLALCLEQSSDVANAGIHFAKAAQLAPDIPYIHTKLQEFRVRDDKSNKMSSK